MKKLLPFIFLFWAKSILAVVPGLIKIHAPHGFAASSVQHNGSSVVAGVPLVPVTQTDSVPASKNLKVRSVTPERLANTALTLGIISIVSTATLVLAPFGFFIGLAALFTGFRVLRLLKASVNTKKSKRKAFWAIALGAISTVATIAAFVFIVNVLAGTH